MKLPVSDYRLEKTKECWEHKCKRRVTVVESRITGKGPRSLIEYWGYCQNHWKEMCEVRGGDAKRIAELFSRRKNETTKSVGRTP